MTRIRAIAPLVVLLTAAFAGACSGTDEGAGLALVRLKNGFNNPELTGFQPPWTICRSSYRGVEFGQLGLGETSDGHDVPAGLDHVLMVAAWDDPSCDPARSLPIATKAKEEVVSGQTRTITVGMTNHQGPCPPEGVPPIPQEQYDRILNLWPEYGFKAYADRTHNTQCAGSGGSSSDGGSAPDAGGDGGVP
jgi:hypothetical protein